MSKSGVMAGLMAEMMRQSGRRGRSDPMAGMGFLDLLLEGPGGSVRDHETDSIRRIDSLIREKWTPEVDKSIVAGYPYQPETLKYKLDAFRKYLGDDDYYSLLKTPNFGPLMDEFDSEQRQNNTRYLAQRFKGLLPENHGVTDEQMFKYISYLIDTGKGPASHVFGQ